MLQPLCKRRHASYRRPLGGSTAYTAFERSAARNVGRLLFRYSKFTTSHSPRHAITCEPLSRSPGVLRFALRFARLFILWQAENKPMRQSQLTVSSSSHKKHRSALEGCKRFEKLFGPYMPRILTAYRTRIKFIMIYVWEYVPNVQLASVLE